MSVMSLATRDQTVLCASTTPQIEEENFQRDRADATETPSGEAEKVVEAVAERRAMATGPRIVMVIEALRGRFLIQ